ncbi:MAG: diguanylate cyclase [Candidatus Omnitrophota bacterium]|nr:diguanylate cyclase [Candidatus Omnitrophota bacterium]
MNYNDVKVLLIEDEGVHADLIQRMLKGAKKASFTVEVCDTLVKGLERLAKGNIDIVLLDLTLPDSVGLETFGRVHAHAPLIPIVVITSSSDENQAVTAFQKGAQEYLVKEDLNVDLISRSIRYAIERNKVRVELHSVQDRLEKINSCFLGFGEDPHENIRKLTSLFGELLGATCALYNCLDRGGMLCSMGQWQVPADYKSIDKPDGHICYDVMKEADGEAFIVRDLQHTKYADSDPNVKRYKLETYIGYPIKWKNEVIGSLCAVYQKDYVPSEDDMRLVSIIAAGVEVEERRARAEDKVKEGERFLSSVFSSIQDGINILDKDYNIVRVNPTMEKWYAHNMPLVGKKCYEAYHCRSVQCEVCPSRDTLRTGKSAYEIVHKTGANGEIVGYMDLYSFPLIDAATGKMTGVIEYVRDITERKRAEDDLRKVNKDLLTSNKRLNQLSLRDLHTGLYNHRYLAEIIDAEFYRSKKLGSAIGVLMLDVDYFKSINDTYGHRFGDMVLKQLAQHLRRMTRQYDVVIRYGGEEFVIMSPGTDRMHALMLAQRILESISLHNFGDAKTSVKLKVSLAVASYPEDKVANAMDLIKLSETILTRAKEEGGNRIYSSMDRRSGGKGAQQQGKGPDAGVLQKRLEKLHKEANESLTESIFAFAKTIEVKDHYTGKHVERTVKYATNIARALNLPSSEIEMVRQAAMLHDLGKIGISESILNKEAKLTKKEIDEIRKHPKIAADILRPIHVLNAIIPFILYHHERWDGKGYPNKLKGEDIPLGARIVAIADVYQALISHRPYRKAFSRSKALGMIKEASGTQFDPRIVNVFLEIIKKDKKK